LHSSILPFHPSFLPSFPHRDNFPTPNEPVTGLLTDGEEHADVTSNSVRRAAVPRAKRTTNLATKESDGIFAPYSSLTARDCSHTAPLVALFCAARPGVLPFFLPGDGR
jgi:hypothetical protein